MPNRKATLVTTILRRHLLLAGITLIAMLLGLLALTDILNMRSHRQTLVHELESIETVDFSSSPSVGVYQRTSDDRISFILLDNKGRWAAGENFRGGYSPHRERKGPRPRWKEAATVLRKDHVDGYGYLPWVKGPVLWAARVMYDPGGEHTILVAWHQVSRIRSTALEGTYAVVAAAIVFSFLIGVILELRTARRVTTVIDAIAISSSKMAAGDYHVMLPQQSSLELDRVSTAIMRLAQNLDQTTAELVCEREHLRNLEAAQRKFVADASHELRAPLTSMRVTLEAWQDGILRPDEQPQSIEHLRKETERLSTLVTNLLDLSRIESGRETLEVVPVDLRAIAEELVLFRRGMNCARVTIDIPEDMPPVLGDQGAVHRIVQNLLENACRFTEPTGNVMIWARVVQEQVRFGVSDNGCGIDPQELPRIWDRFARAAQLRAQATVGSGLGLAIVQALVQAMGGTVGAESTPGEGTTVWVQLPMALVAKVTA